ncbi:MAG: AmmeMemoRadiSam system protein B, partial [Cyanobacteria bacterium REEB65]|nr:AmmeMemoRadiSam system protein B [Cyanobacteria bacterium REEB65]
MLLPPLRPLDIRAMPDDPDRFLVVDPLELQPEPMAVPLAFLLVAQHFDGKRTAEDVAQQLQNQGIEILPRSVRFIADQLQAAHLLADADVQARLRQLEASALVGPRPARLADRCYPADPVAAASWIDGLVGLASAPASPGDLAGIVLPHIDPRLGGATYGSGYRVLANAAPSEVYVILGIGHAGLQHGISLAPVDFATPFGPVPVDRPIADELISRLGDWIVADQFVQQREHSIEFQAVFLQHVVQQPFTMLPLLTSFGPADLPHMREVLATLRRVLGESGKRVTVIASVDFSHIGPMYGDSTAAEPMMSRVEERDREAIGQLQAANAAGLSEAVYGDRNSTRICGYSSMWSMLELVEPRSGTLLDYSR